MYDYRSMDDDKLVRETTRKKLQAYLNSPGELLSNYHLFVRHEQEAFEGLLEDYRLVPKDIPLVTEQPPPRDEPLIREPRRVELSTDDLLWEEPHTIKRYLDRFVYGQKGAKVALAVAFSDYMSPGYRPEHKPAHTLLIGPSGTGKTYMITLLCDAAGIPFVKVSLANVTSEGYKGENLGEIVRRLGEAQKGILFLDELDKVAVSDTHEAGTLFPAKLQQELLAYFTGQTVRGVDTSRFLLVTAGAFHGGFGKRSLYQIIQQRLGGGKEIEDERLLDHLTDQDLIDYGLIPELVGRIANKAALSPIDEEGLYHILREIESSPARTAADYFSAMGISMEFTDQALREMGRIATRGVGVRGLQSIINELTQEYAFDRALYRGKSLRISAADVRARFERRVEFVQPDEVRIDWRDPASIVSYLDMHVVGQREAKEELARSFHLYHLSLQDGGRKLPVPNLMLAGPPGSGKTLMVGLLAAKAELPIATVSIAGKVASGYAGEAFLKVFDLFGRSPVGICCIDDVDEILLNPRDPLNEELVACLEQVRGKPTTGYLFILSGTFQQIRDIKAQRSLGDPSRVTRRDLLKCGVSRRLLGRIPTVVNLEALSAGGLVQLLEKGGSVIDLYRDYFRTMGKELELDPKALELIAQKAAQSDGARALNAIAGQLFGPYMMRLAELGETISIAEEDARRILDPISGAEGV